MQLMVYIYYRLLFFKNNNFKYTTISRRRSSILSRYFTFFFSSFSSSLSLTSIIYIVYRILCMLYMRFCYVMYYIVSEIYIGGRFLEHCFYYYSQQIISAVAKESLIPYNLTQRPPETQNLQYYNTEHHAKPNQTNVKQKYI